MAQGVFLPEHLSSRIALLPQHHLGVHRVAVRLRSGEMVYPVLVAWEMEIVRVQGSEDIPFRTDDIVDVFRGPPRDSAAPARVATSR